VNARTYMVWTALLALVGCGSPLVGLECQDGFERCGSGCYDLARDQLHCGSCDLACNASQHCELSMCMAGPPTDAGPDGGDGGLDARVLEDGRIVGPDGTLGDGAAGDGAIGNDASVGDGGDDDAATPPPVLCMGAGSPADCVCGIGTTKCDTSCVDLNADHENCGMCGMACAADRFCNQGMCDLICTPPVVLCTGQCVDFSSDDGNCGSCGFACAPTAQCIDSKCVGQLTGNVVAIGHDMTGILRPAIRQLVGNAVFLAPRPQVRVLVYDAATSVASRAGVTAAIAAAAASIGRQYTLSVALPETVTAQLATADVFVIDPQQGARDDELTALGTTWSAALSSFLYRGGVVVLFDGGPDSGDTNLGTWQILRAAGDPVSMAPLLQVTGSTLLSQRLLSNVRPGDAIGSSVPSPYQSSGLTVGFTLDAPGALINPHNVVVRDDPLPPPAVQPTPSLLPVVVHAVFEP
jgi:hypothetical protein